MLAVLEKISKQYDHPVLNEISLTVNQGDSIAVIGPSGSGKSTLLNILGTLDRPTSGKVFLQGKPVDTLTGDQCADLRNRVIGFVFQLHYLLPQLTLLENVLLPLLPVKEKDERSRAEQRAFRLLERVGLQDKRLRCPAELSVGECQRAAVVRALINHPILLLADEPTGSLDEENASMLGDLLATLNREEKLAMVVVTHSREIAGKMNILYRLHGGKLERVETV